jgi:hypothetical protein
MKPITPTEVGGKKAELISKTREAIPSEVFEVFNELIVKYWDGNRSCLHQEEIVRLIVDKLHLENDRPLYDNHWLDVEGIYREAGWKVDYKKPDWGENYDPYFIFSKKRKT